jgi:hypothetical protein
MTTSEDDIDQMETAILAAMANEAVPAWTTPDDLSRISIEALIADDTLWQQLRSRFVLPRSYPGADRRRAPRRTLSVSACAPDAAP